MTEHLTYLQI